MNAEKRPSGIVLIVTLAVLGLLSVLAVSFIQLSRLERTISRNYMDRTRALLAAESGIEYAITRIHEFTGGAASAEEQTDLSWHGGKASFNVPDDPLISGYIGDSAGDIRFSLQVDDDTGKLNLNDTNGNWNIDTDPTPDSDEYGQNDDKDLDDASPRLAKIIETLVDILNPGQPGLGALAAASLIDARDQRYGGRFSSMRQVRAALVDENVFTPAQYETFLPYVTLASWQDPNVIKPNYKVHVSVPAGTTQPSDRFDVFLWADCQNKGYALEPRCPININSAPPDLLQALIQPLQGWYLKEGPPSTMTTRFYGGWMGGCFLMNMWPSNPKQQFYHIDEPEQASSAVDGSPCYKSWEGNMIMTDGRYPGQGLGAPDCNDLIRGGRVSNRYGEMMKTIPFSAAQAAAVAKSIHNRIHGPTFHPFRTWEEIHDFLKNRDGNGLSPEDLLPADAALESEPGMPLTALPPAEKLWWRNYYFDLYSDLLIAMFNPNSDLNDYNPNKNLYRRIDKGQLTSYTTELTFSTGTHYFIRSTGSVREGSADIASVSVETSVQLFDLWRVTSQSQFLHGLRELGNNLGNFFSRSHDSPYRTFGAGGMDPDEVGFTVQSYPEPYVPDALDMIANSYYDGQLQLATYEYSDPAYPLLCLHADFSSDLKPRVFGNNPGSTTALGNLATDDMYLNAPGHPDSYEPPATGFHVSEGYNYPTAQPLSWRRDPDDALYDPSAGQLAGVLYPDGGFSEAGRTLAYRSANAFCLDGAPGWDMAYRYTVAFWIKPNFQPALSNRIRKLYTFEESPNRGLQWVSGSVPGLYYFPHHFAWQDILHEQRPQSPAETQLMTTYTYVDPRWMAPHSLSMLMVMGSYLNLGGIYNASVNNFGGSATPRTCHDFPEHDPTRDEPGLEKINFEGHVWSHCVVGQTITNPSNQDVPFPDNYAMQSVNGYTVPGQYMQLRWQHYSGTLPDYRLALRGGFGSQYETPNYLRLGELPTATISRFAADSTFDEFVVFPVASFEHDAYMSNLWNEGRYLSFTDKDGTAGVYTSGLFSLQDLGYKSRDDERIVIRDVSWTLYWPRNNRGLDAASGNVDLFADNVKGMTANPDDEEDPTVPNDWDPISIDLCVTGIDGTGLWLCENPPGTPKKEFMPSYAGGSSLLHPETRKSPVLKKNEYLQFRVYFNLDPVNPQTLYESPVLDDLTFTLIPQHPRILSWEVLSA